MIKAQTREKQMIGNKLERICFFLLIALTIGISPVLAQDSKILDLGLASDDELTNALNKADDIELVTEEDNLTTGAAAPAEAASANAVPADSVPAKTAGQETTGGSQGNDFLDQSRRLVKLAEEAFNEADYDKSAMLADEAAWLAEDAANAAAPQPPEKPGSAGSLSPNASSGTALSLPATYTVRPWSVSKDCFWNIAGFPWVYGDPHQWRLLYNANKSKLPNPNNPNVIEPGTVLDIPSIKGEVRQGAWESGKTYEPFQITGNK